MTNYDNKLRDYSFYRDDKEVVLSEVQKNGLNLQYASENLQNDKEIVWAAVNKNALALQFASKKWRNNEELVTRAIKSNYLAIEFASPALRGNWSMIYDSLSGEALQYASLELRNDKEVVMAAVLHSKEALQYASEELRGDREVALAATTKGGIVLKHMSKSLQAEEAIVDLCVGKNGSALEFASKELKNNKKIVMTAIGQNPKAFHFASPQLQKDSDVMSATINRDIYMLEHIPQWNNDYYKMSYLYIRSDDHNILQHMGADLKNNEQFALFSVTKSGNSIHYFDEKIRANKSIMWIAVNNNPESLQYASKKLQDDIELVNCALEIETVKRNTEISVLAYCSDRLCDDETIVRKALNAHLDALQYASDRIKNDINFIIPLVKRSVDFLAYAGDRIKDNTDLMLEFCKTHKVQSSDNLNSALQYASSRIRNDKDFITTLVNEGVVAPDTLTLKHAGNDLLNNKEIMKEFVEKDPNSFKYASEALRNDIDFVNFTIENRHNVPEIRLYEIEMLIGQALKKEIGNENIEKYCSSYVLSQKLYNEIPQKTLEIKPKIKI